MTMGLGRGALVYFWPLNLVLNCVINQSHIKHSVVKLIHARIQNMGDYLNMKLLKTYIVDTQ